MKGGALLSHTPQATPEALPAPAAAQSDEEKRALVALRDKAAEAWNRGQKDVAAYYSVEARPALR